MTQELFRRKQRLQLQTLRGRSLMQTRTASTTVILQALQVQVEITSNSSSNRSGTNLLISTTHTPFRILWPSVSARAWYSLVETELLLTWKAWVV